MLPQAQHGREKCPIPPPPPSIDPMATQEDGDFVLCCVVLCCVVLCCVVLCCVVLCCVVLCCVVLCCVVLCCVVLCCGSEQWEHAKVVQQLLDHFWTYDTMYPKTAGSAVRSTPSAHAKSVTLASRGASECHNMEESPCRCGKEDKEWTPTSFHEQARAGV